MKVVKLRVVYMHVMFLLLVFSISILYYMYPVLRKYVDNDLSAKELLIILSALFSVSIIGLILIDKFTALPQHSSGNGNLALVVIFPLLPVLFSLGGFLSISSHRYFAQKSNLICFVTLSGMLLLLISIINKQINFYNSLLTVLQEFDRPISTDTLLISIDQYTNTMFFNQYTFAMWIILSIIIGAIVSRLKNKGNVSC